MRVIAQGRLVQRSFETREGEKRSVVELQVDEIGPSLKYASAKVERRVKSNAGGGLGGPQQEWGGAGYAPAGGQADEIGRAAGREREGMSGVGDGLTREPIRYHERGEESSVDKKMKTEQPKSRADV